MWFELPFLEAGTTLLPLGATVWVRAEYVLSSLQLGRRDMETIFPGDRLRPPNRKASSQLWAQPPEDIHAAYPRGEQYLISEFSPIRAPVMWAFRESPRWPGSAAATGIFEFGREN